MAPDGDKRYSAMDGNWLIIETSAFGVMRKVFAAFVLSNHLPL